MRLVRFEIEGARRIGMVVDGQVLETEGGWGDLLSSRSVPGATVEKSGRSFPLEDCKLLAPLPDTGRGLFCVGMNYVDHASEAGKALKAERPDVPIVFVKTVDAVADPGAVLSLDPSISTEFDWEVELAVVVGRGGRRIDPRLVEEHIAGYTILNDVTARDLQRRHVQWHLGKNVDRSSPLGPWVVTADEIAYPPDVEISLSVNGMVKQRARTSELVFDIADLMSRVSRYIALEPGDIIATGTPAGVGFARTPPEFLRFGDLIEANIEGIGTLRNVVDEPVNG
jgi:2-keto-4-pentenoate hydratase/2-oxohepta-3-ene-1,7-dioic acid hydratase in catechol pathway